MTNPKEPTSVAASPSTEGAPVPALQARAIKKHRKILLQRLKHIEASVGERTDVAAQFMLAERAAISWALDELKAHPSPQPPLPVVAVEAWKVEQKRRGEESDAFDEWWTTSGQGAEPLHTMITENAARAAWQKCAERAHARTSPSAQPEQPGSIYPTSDCVACASKTALPEGMPQGEWLTEAKRIVEQYAHAYFNRYTNENTLDDGMMPKFEAKLRAHLSLRIAPQVDAQQVEDAARYRWLAELKCNSLHLTRDGDHACNYRTAADWIDNNPDDFMDVPLDEIRRMRDTNTIWALQVYPHTPIGFNWWHGATLDAAIDRARSLASAATKKGGVSMAIRIIVRLSNYAEMSPHGGGFLDSFKTVEVESPELEAMLRLDYGNRCHATVIGAELLPATQKGGK